MIRCVVCICFLFISMPLAAEDSDARAVRDQDFVADYFSPADEGRYGVIVLSGSGGGKAEEFARRIVTMGYPVLSLSYFEDGPLPEALELIPLEYFDAPKRWLMNRPETKSDGVILVGLSKGAELALLLATEDPEIKGIVAVAPSSVVWAGIPLDRSKITMASSSWSRNGNPVDFVPYIPRDGLRTAGLDAMRFWHIAALTDKDTVEKALIKVERIASPILLISGSEDSAWPATAMSAAICKRANQNSDPENCRHLDYADGDHLLTNHKPAVNKEISAFLNALSP